MKKYIVGAVLSIGMFVSPALTQAAGLTTGQANSIIAVVQAAPGIPASAFINLITAFSNITVTQATSLITVVQAAPGVAPDAFVNLLISFTVDTTQAATQSTNPTSSALTPVVSLTISPTIVASGQPTTVTWSSTNAISCTFTSFGDWASGGAPLNGSATVNQLTSKSISLTCQSANGQLTTKSVNVTVTSAAPYISSIRSEDGTPINPGDMVIVSGSNLYGAPFTLDGNYGTPVSQQDPSGTSFSFVVPWNTSAGTHTVQVAQKVTGVLGNSATFTVTVQTQAVSALPVISSLSPWSAKPGDLMYAYGSGLYGNSFSIDDNPVTSLNSQATDGTSVSFWLPSNLVYGRHVIKVEQKVTGVQGTSILFDIVTQ